MFNGEAGMSSLIRGRLSGLAIAVLLLLPIIILIPCPVTASDTPVRPSALAGMWYSADPAELKQQVGQYIAGAALPKVEGRIVALAVPHAGHVYSGPVAGYGYALLKDMDIHTVILAGPSHRQRFPGVSINLQDYETPLGRVAVNRDLAEKIIKAGGNRFASYPEVHAKEHCLEIQLPFLQVVKPGVRIVPILFGSDDDETRMLLAKAMAEAAKDPGVLVIASTDLSHFHDAGTARNMDGALIEKVKAYDTDAVSKALADGSVEACGGGALVSVMTAARMLGADKAVALKYAHSGMVSRDNTKVVGYMAVAFTSSATGKTPAQAEEPPCGVDLGLNKTEQGILLKIARQAILAELDNRDYTLPADLTSNLEMPRGAFVTLKRNGQLRGCIGHIVSKRPLAETVAVCAVQAAFHDPRFNPLQKSEVEGLTLEVSALTPFEQVTDTNTIEVGKHGLLIRKGYYQGLLLPQVPVEQGWDRVTFLNQTCRKAGLPSGAWKEESAELFRFSAQVFGESEH
jgi:AmmeMemoRadiSam system protein B/AmmeMemoRadiSam system protein A